MREALRGVRLREPSTAPVEWSDSNDQRDRHDSAEPMDRAEPTDSTDAREPMDSSEPVDHRDDWEFRDAVITASWPVAAARPDRSAAVRHGGQMAGVVVPTMMR